MNKKIIANIKSKSKKTIKRLGLHIPIDGTIFIQGIKPHLENAGIIINHTKYNQNGALNPLNTIEMLQSLKTIIDTLKPSISDLKTRYSKIAIPTQTEILEALYDINVKNILTKYGLTYMCTIVDIQDKTRQITLADLTDQDGRYKLPENLRTQFINITHSYLNKWSDGEFFPDLDKDQNGFWFSILP